MSPRNVNVMCSRTCEPSEYSERRENFYHNGFKQLTQLALTLGVDRFRSGITRTYAD